VIVQHREKRSAQPRLEVERIELPNGLVLLLSENHSAPAVSVNAAIKAGSRFESDSKAGLASLTGELLDSGTKRRSSQEIAETIEAAGGHLATFGEYQLSGVAVTLLSDDVELSLDVSSDLLLNATFPPDKVQQEIDRRLAQIKARLDEPRIQASDVFNEIVFEGSPQHRPAIGYEDSVKRLVRDDIEAYFREYYIPNNALLAIVGDIDKDQIKRLVDRKFAEWEPQRTFKAPEIPRTIRRSFPVTRFVFAPKEQVNIFIGHSGIQRRNPDYYALLVMDTILGSSPGFTSRIPRVLRDEQGLAYSTFSNITSSASLDAGRFIAYIGTAPENLGKAVSGLRSEIQRIVDEPVTPEELEIAKLYLTGSFVFKFQRNSQIADFLIEAELYGLGFDYLDRYADLIKNVRIEDVSRVAREYIDPNALTTVVVGPVDGNGKIVSKE